MSTEEDVLTAIREIDAQSDDKHPEIHHYQVAERLGCPADDPEFQRYLARAATTGIIEPLSEVDQLEGPTSFRLTY
jgi:hypothetical protein